MKRIFPILLIICLIWTTVFSGGFGKKVRAAETEITYTVTTAGQGNFVLANKKASEGPITLTYTVESATAARAGNNGVIATTTPSEQYPYLNGSMRFHNVVNHLMVEGRTYAITIGKGNDNKVTFTGKITDADGTTRDIDIRATNGDLPHAAGEGKEDCQYFGLYIEIATTAKLTNVSCVDAEGNDLGLQSNQDSCTIVTEETEDEEPSPSPNAVAYTLTTNGERDLAITNKKAADGPITLTYTVESATAARAGNNGVIATTTPREQYPYLNGSMRFHNVVNHLMVEGCTYTITIGAGNDNKVTFSGKITEADGTIRDIDVRVTNGDLPHAAGEGKEDCQYFGLYIEIATTAKLINVSCVDAEGNDLGVQANQISCTIVGDEKEDHEPEPEPTPDPEPTPEDMTIPVGSNVGAETYTVRLGGEHNYFLSNGIASEKAVTLRYTVQSAQVEEVLEKNNGVIATTVPTMIYPYDEGAGSMRFHNVLNHLFMEGCTYEISMQMDADHKIIFSGNYITKDGIKILLDSAEGTGTLPHAAGTGNEKSSYYGIYIAPATTATLTEVSCVDADGKDLGLQLNHANSVIEKNGEEGSGKERKKLPSNYRMITLGNFGIEDGIYKNTFLDGAYALSMHKTIFTTDITFTSDVGEDFRYGGRVNGWLGLRFWSEGNALLMEDVEGYTDRYTFTGLVAGTDLVNTEFNLKISTEYVDSDKDGIKDDVKLGIWFNDVLYGNEYIYLKDYKDILGKYMCVYSANEVAGIQVKNVKGVETGVDYSLVGFTRNWRKELGL